MKNILLLLILLVSLFSKAQETVPELVTDRPDQTESAVVVPIRSLQIETGFLFEGDNTNSIRQNSFNYNTTLFRYGLFDRMELRLGFAFLSVQDNVNTDSLTTSSGFAPLYTGFKILVFEERGLIPQIAFLGGLVLPFTAAKEFKASYAAPVMRFAFSNTLSEDLSLGYNLGAEWYGDSAIPDYFYSVSLGYSLNPKLGSFIEIFGFVPEQGEASHLVDAGFTYLIRHNFQVDVSGGLGLNKAATDGFLSFGLTYCIPN